LLPSLHMHHLPFKHVLSLPYNIVMGRGWNTLVLIKSMRTFGAKPSFGIQSRTHDAALEPSKCFYFFQFQKRGRALPRALNIQCQSRGASIKSPWTGTLAYPTSLSTPAQPNGATASMRLPSSIQLKLPRQRPGRLAEPYPSQPTSRINFDVARMRVASVWQRRDV
jgi:hypothetical protein